VGKYEGRRPFGTLTRTWEDNIEVGLREVEWGVDWIDLAQDWDRWSCVMNAVTNIRVP
jgi:hypothetical protein